MLAEILVRKGLRRLTLMDGDTFAVGNARRHLLTLDEISAWKAQALAERLNAVSLFADVEAVTTALRWPIDESAFLVNHDIIVDCTSEDDVVHSLSALPGDKKMRFYSFSMRTYASALLAFACDGPSIGAEAFFSTVSRLEPDVVEDDIPIRDAGCQNPAFPASWDRIIVLASHAVRFMELQADAELATPVFKTIDVQGQGE